MESLGNNYQGSGHVDAQNPENILLSSSESLAATREPAEDIGLEMHYDTTNTVPESAAPQGRRAERAKNWVRRHKVGLLLGAAAASAAASFSMHPGETVHEIETKVPWAVSGMLVADAVNVAGIGMMVASTGSKVDWKHFWRIRSQMDEVKRHAQQSKVFNAGFWTSTTGGVGAFGVAAAAVLPNFPVESWGMLTPLIADLGHTVVTRVAIRQAVSSRDAQSSPTSIELPD